jgi:hypothetical protein
MAEVDQCGAVRFQKEVRLKDFQGSEVQRRLEQVLVVQAIRLRSLVGMS